MYRYRMLGLCDRIVVAFTVDVLAFFIYTMGVYFLYMKIISNSYCKQ